MMDRSTPAEDCPCAMATLNIDAGGRATATPWALNDPDFEALRPAVRELVMALDPPVAAAATASSEPPARSPEDTAEPDAGIG
jgi:hypothetical protein